MAGLALETGPPLGVLPSAEFLTGARLAAASTGVLLPRGRGSHDRPLTVCIPSARLRQLANERLEAGEERMGGGVW
jgi:hypothetical protein